MILGHLKRPNTNAKLLSGMTMELPFSWRLSSTFTWNACCMNEIGQTTAVSSIPASLLLTWPRKHFPQGDPSVWLWDTSVKCSCSLVWLEEWSNYTPVQRWAKMWALGCVNPASWLPLALGCKFTQPRTHLIAHFCTVAQVSYIIW